MPLTIRVIDYDDLRGHVEYTIEVRDSSGESWSFKRRYSALRFFHELIRKSEKKVPNFPPKKLFGNLNPDFLDNRKTQIEQYFIALTRIPEILHSSAFKDFIKPFDKAPIVKNRRQNKVLTKDIINALNHTTNKTVEEASTNFVSLLPFVPISKEDIEKIEQNYSERLNNIKFCQLDLMPKGIPENLKKILKKKADLKNTEKNADMFMSTFINYHINADCTISI